MTEPRRTPKISVNIPIYNGEKTIALAVKSILAQSFTDFELIVVNDCSKDSTAQILNEFNDPRLRVIHHEQNQGISRTRNNLLRNSRGDYVAVLDGDDFALPQRLEKQIRAIEQDPSLDGVFSWIQYFKGKDPYDSFETYRPKREASEMRETILFESPFPHSSAFIRRDVMGQGYREDLTCAEDYAKWLELLFSGKRLGMIFEPLSAGWVHPPTNYTREKMQLNVKKLHEQYFGKILGRHLTLEEVKSQWALYEILEWIPASRKEALEDLKSAEHWVRTIRTAEFHDPNINRARFSREAEKRLYLLCSQATLYVGLRVLGFTRNMTIKERVKLVARGILR